MGTSQSSSLTSHILLPKNNPHAPLQWTPSPPLSLLPSLRPRPLPSTRSVLPGGAVSDPECALSPTSLPSTRSVLPGGAVSDPECVSSLRELLPDQLLVDRWKSANVFGRCEELGVVRCI